MPYDSIIFRKDMAGAIKALEDDDVEYLNIAANRIMSNSLFGTEKKFVFPAFFLKDISFNLGLLRGSLPTSPYSTAKSVAMNYARSLSREVQNETFEPLTLWKSYSDFKMELRKLTLAPIEQSIYDTTDLEFSKSGFSWLLNYLQENLGSMEVPKNILLKGVLNEMVRLYRNHGTDLNGVLTISLLTALDWCNDYARAISTSETSFAKIVRDEIIPNAKDSLAALQKTEINIEDIDNLMWKFIVQWREYFLRYLELPRVVLSAREEPEKAIQLPEETKKKLTEAITKSIEGPG